MNKRMTHPPQPVQEELQDGGESADKAIIDLTDVGSQEDDEAGWYVCGLEAPDTARYSQLQDRMLMAWIHTMFSRMHKKKNWDELVHDLAMRFPNAHNIMEITPYMLERSGVGHVDSYFFSVIPALTRRAIREAYGKRPKLNRLSKMAGFVRHLFLGAHAESFYVVLLTATGILIDACKLQEGTADRAPFYARKVMAQAVTQKARAIVICHNHPGGTLRPSREDLLCTLEMLKLTTTLGIPLLDHIIVAIQRPMSIRDCGLIAEDLWNMQDPGNRLLRDWVDVDLLA